MRVLLFVCMKITAQTGHLGIPETPFETGTIE
jgi:hypothetical protein